MHKVEDSDYDSLPSIDSNSHSDSLPPVDSDADSVAVVDAVVDHILDQVVYLAEEDEESMEGNITLHDSGPWEHLEDVVEEVVMEEAVVEQPLAQEVVVEQPLLQEIVVEQPLPQEAVVEEVGRPRRSQRLKLKFKIKRDNL